MKISFVNWKLFKTWLINFKVLGTSTFWRRIVYCNTELVRCIYMFKPQLMRHWDSLPNTPTPPPILTFYRYLGYPLLLTWMHFVILLSHLYISFSIFLCIKILAVGCGVIKSALIQINYRDYPLNSCDTYII